MTENPAVMRLRAEARRLRDKAYDLERDADDLDAEAEELQEKLTVDIPSICDRLLAGYLSGTARELVEQVRLEGHELPGFREVCLTYGEALP